MRNYRYDTRCSHLRRPEREPNIRNGVETLKGVDGTTIKRLVQGTPREPDTRGSLIEQLEQQKAERLRRNGD